MKQTMNQTMNYLNSIDKKALIVALVISFIIGIIIYKYKNKSVAEDVVEDDSISKISKWKEIGTLTGERCLRRFDMNAHNNDKKFIEINEDNIKSIIEQLEKNTTQQIGFKFLDKTNHDELITIKIVEKKEFMKKILHCKRVAYNDTGLTLERNTNSEDFIHFIQIDNENPQKLSQDEKLKINKIVVCTI